MGGGFMYAGNSAAARLPRFAASDIPGNFQIPKSVTVNIPSGSQPCHQNTGDCFLGPVPSRVEVENAIHQLQSFMHHVSASKSENDGLLVLLYDNDLEMLQSPGFVKFSDAFYMMQAEPDLQNLVLSISSDNSVWEAIMINKAVQDLRGSVPTGRKEKQLSYPEEVDIAEVIVRWITGFTTSKVLELLEKFTSLVNEIFQRGSNKKATPGTAHLLDEKVRSSFLLCVVILMIVVVTRAQGY